MKQAEFLYRIAEALDHEGVISADQDLMSIGEWDSLGLLSIVELVSDLGLTIRPDQLGHLQNISELIELAREVIDG